MQSDETEETPERDDEGFELDLEGEHFMPALLSILAVGLVVFGISLAMIFAEHKRSFARLEGYPYTGGEPPTRPKSWPSSEELGAVGLPRAPVAPDAPPSKSASEFFQAAWNAVKAGDGETFLECGRQLVAASPGTGIESILDSHIRADDATEMFVAVWVAGQRLRAVGGEPKELLAQGTPSMFMNRMLSGVEPGPQAELIIRQTIELFGKEAAQTAALQLGEQWKVRASVRVALLQSPVGREAFFERRAASDPADALNAVAPFIDAADEAWVRAQLDTRQGAELSLVAGLAGVLHTRTGAFESELEGPIRDLLRERLETAPKAKAAITALRYIERDWAPGLLLARLARATEIDELPLLNQALLTQLGTDQAPALAAIARDEAASLGARTYAALMLRNLSQRLSAPELWEPAAEAGIAVFGAAMRDGNPILRKATFAVLLLDGFEAGADLLRTLIGDPADTTLQMFLIKNLKDRTPFHAALKALREDPEQKPIVRDAVSRLFGAP